MDEQVAHWHAKRLGVRSMAWQLLGLRCAILELYACASRGLNSSDHCRLHLEHAPEEASESAWTASVASWHSCKLWQRVHIICTTPHVRHLFSTWTTSRQLEKSFVRRTCLKASNRYMSCSGRIDKVPSKFKQHTWMLSMRGSTASMLSSFKSFNWRAIIMPSNFDVFLSCFATELSSSADKVGHCS